MANYRSLDDICDKAYCGTLIKEGDFIKEKLKNWKIDLDENPIKNIREYKIENTPNKTDTQKNYSKTKLKSQNF